MQFNDKYTCLELVVLFSRVILEPENFVYLELLSHGTSYSKGGQWTTLSTMTFSMCGLYTVCLVHII